MPQNFEVAWVSTTDNRELLPLDTYARRYRAELLDRENGGYFTCLTREGAVYDSRKYVWLQGRAVWLFSKLYNELEPRQEYLDAARPILDFMRKHARDPQGRYYFSLTREGLPSFYQRKPYAAVFAMLGMLEFSKATSDASLREEAIALFWQIRDWIKDPTLLGRPSAPLPSLADVMVTASMASEIARIDPDPRYRDILRECLNRSLAFYDPARRIFLEYQPADTPEGRQNLRSLWSRLGKLLVLCNAHSEPRPQEAVFTTFSAVC